MGPYIDHGKTTSMRIAHAVNAIHLEFRGTKQPWSNRIRIYTATNHPWKLKILLYGTDWQKCMVMVFGFLRRSKNCMLHGTIATITMATQFHGYKYGWERSRIADLYTRCLWRNSYSVSVYRVYSSGTLLLRYILRFIWILKYKIGKWYYTFKYKICSNDIGCLRFFSCNIYTRIN